MSTAITYDEMYNEIANDPLPGVPEEMRARIIEPLLRELEKEKHLYPMEYGVEDLKRELEQLMAND